MNFTDFVKKTFSENGWRMTAGVRNILVVLEEADTILSVQEISEKLKEINREIDITTIYRILEKLASVELIHEVEGKWIRCTDPENPDEHHFLICENCGKSEEIFLDYRKAIAKQLKKEKGFDLNRVSLTFYGICRDCQ